MKTVPPQNCVFKISQNRKETEIFVFFARNMIDLRVGIIKSE